MSLVNRIIHKGKVMLGCDMSYPFTRDEKIHVEKELRRRNQIKISGDMEPICFYSEDDDRRDHNLRADICRKKKPFDKMEIMLNPFGKTPLTAMAAFYQKGSAYCHITIKGRNGGSDVSYEMTSRGPDHMIPIFYLYGGHANEVSIDMEMMGESYHHEVVVETKPLPEKLLDAVKVSLHEEASAFPMILVTGKSTPYPFVFDERGEIRYYLTMRPSGYGLMPLANGRYILVERKVMLETYQYPYSTQFYEIDLLGRVYKVYHVPKGGHHDICEMGPGGNLLMITNSNRKHIGDVIMEIDRETGEIVKRLDMRDVFGETFCDMIGWVHLNTIRYNAKEQTILTCARNLHSLIKIDWKTCELQWILCDPRFYENTPYSKYVLKPVGDVAYSYQAHSPYEVEEDLDGNPDTRHFAFFDNHWDKRRPLAYFDNDPKSYVKIYTVDEKNHTVSMMHQYASEKSKITSNPVVDFEKKRVFSMGAFLEPRIEGCGGIIGEYDFDTERRINKYMIKYFFFRAYCFRPDMECLGAMMEPVRQKVVGFLQKPLPYRGEIGDITGNLESLQGEESVEFFYQNDVLYMNAKDHLVECIYFVGKTTYYRDYKNPKQTETRSDKMKYYHGIPLHMMRGGTYKMILKVHDTLYDAGTIHIDF